MNIVPNNKILNLVRSIEAENDLTNERYQNALSIHVRHGNGEKYFNPSDGRWGVKPPNQSSILEATTQAIEASPTEIQTLVVASDCKAVAQFLASHYQDKFEVIYISKYVQEISAGCNHIDKRFSDSAPRYAVSHYEDDLASLAEILILSKAVSLCGGKSYFFDAIIGFSNVSPEAITRIDNNDRYIKLSEKHIPIVDHPEYARLWQSDAELHQYLPHLDGLFVTGQLSSNFTLFYFDEKLFSGNLIKIRQQLASGKLQNQIIFLRIY